MHNYCYSNRWYSLHNVHVVVHDFVRLCVQVMQYILVIDNLNLVINKDHNNTIIANVAFIDNYDLILL